MYPYLHNKDQLMMDKLSYSFNDPERFDIIVFPVVRDGKEEYYIKRVIGLPGETIELRGGELYTNICGRAILSEEEAFKIIYPLTDCLSYMHSMGIIHRDIKVCVCGGRER